MISAEGGRTLGDAMFEVREAIDFCRYYASEGRQLFGAATRLPGPAGEDNLLLLTGRGVFACISPWNFPLAIFLGQIVAALMAGNTVVAKPAEETPLIAAEAVKLLHAAGVPAEALVLLNGDGGVGAAVVADARIAGVAFTGSTGAAKSIQRALAAKDGPIAPLIAETGGLNAMIVDSTALLEQVLADVLASAFNSAGQRCSALRVLYIQEDAADRFTELLRGAMDQLVIGDPGVRSTDVGPVISPEALANLRSYEDWLAKNAKPVAACKLAQGLAGYFYPPQAHAIQSIAQLPGEVFGPVLHIATWKAGTLNAVIDAINATGYGLTLGVHSRIDATIHQVRSRARAGNIYVNRNMIGAVVGCQPFGGEGLSGTGPKAGGPHYLLRFAAERTISHDTTAIGGNASLLSAGADEQE
jgi:RHH-type transcriptional regulator, proline utilization regulon repressor / proline dehydrogenase / delta 1-pyrroline-5-carboxylate dehydrogenase